MKYFGFNSLAYIFLDFGRQTELVLFCASVLIDCTRFVYCETVDSFGFYSLIPEHIHRYGAIWSTT